jgi:spore coat polysaccharide biosynthesis predicted glycosyltransferase SpsG
LPGSVDDGGTLGDADASATTDAARQLNARCVLVDHYGADGEYLDALSRAGLSVGVIDDFLARDCRAASWLLNQNAGADRWTPTVRNNCTMLLGPRYALLGPEFARARAAVRRRFASDDCRVLVSFGGGEVSEVCFAVVQALLRCQTALFIRCAVPDAPSARRISTHTEGTAHRVELIVDGDMPELMLWSDISINGGGTTCWELCCLGVPMLVLPISADQRQVAEELDRLGCARNLGNREAATAADLLPAAVDKLLATPDERAHMSKRAQDLVDGMGARRAATSLCRQFADA